MKLRIWHLLLLIFVAAVVARVTIKRDTFPFATSEDAAKVNTFNGEVAELVGDEDGPYKLVSGYAESMPVNRSAPSSSSQWVNYQIDGQPKKYQIRTDDDFSTHVNIFENPKGNHLLVVFDRHVP